MNPPPSPNRSGRTAAGEFPQPTSPWESKGLLYAEVVGALAVLALVLFGDARDLLPDTAQAAQAVPAVTAAAAAANSGD